MSDALPIQIRAGSLHRLQGGEGVREVPLDQPAVPSDAAPLPPRESMPSLPQRAGWLKWTLALSAVFVSGLEAVDIRMVKAYVKTCLKDERP